MQLQLHHSWKSLIITLNYNILHTKKRKLNRGIKNLNLENTNKIKGELKCRLNGNLSGGNEN